MGKKIPVEGHPHLVRDSQSGAILNINSSGIQKARKAKEDRKREKERLDKLEYEMSEIKSLLKALVNEKK